MTLEKILTSIIDSNESKIYYNYNGYGNCGGYIACYPIGHKLNSGSIITPLMFLTTVRGAFTAISDEYIFLKAVCAFLEKG